MLKQKLIKTAAAVALLSSAAASAIPTGGGLYDVYHGSAWFDSGQGITVSASTYSACMVLLADTIAIRQGWGWNVTENNGCKKGKYKVFYRKHMAQLESEFRMDDYKEKVEEVKMRKQAEAEAEIELLKKEYRYDEFSAAVEETMANGEAPAKK